MTDGVAEGRENIYKVKLSTQPTGEVRVIADPKNDQISLNDEDYGDPMTLVFDETNWNVEQVVRVSAFDDNIVEFTHESQIEFEIESGKYKDFESKANNNSSDGAIDLGEIKGGYTWKNLGVAGTDRDWFKFTLTDAATTEDFVRVDITEGNTENLKFNIYKGGNLSRVEKTTGFTSNSGSIDVEKTTGFTSNSGSIDEEGILTLLDDQYAEISKDRIGDWGSEDFEVSLSIKSNTGDNKIAGDPIRNYGALFIRALQESYPFTGPSAFLYNNGSILFRLRGDERLTLPAGTVSSWSDWNDLKFKYIADSKTLKIFVNGQEKGSKQLTKTVELSDFVDAPLFFGDLYPAICQVKALFDPLNRLNPGKIAGPSPKSALLKIDEVPTRGANDRRIAPSLQTTASTALLCNGNGACHNYDPDDRMCPSWKATRDRRYTHPKAARA